MCNLGENGRGIPSVVPDFPADTDLLTLILGTNELLQGRSSEEAVQRLERFLSGLTLERDKILLIAPPSMAPGEWVLEQRLIDDSRSFAQRCKELAERLGVRFTDAGAWSISLTYDGVHFTEAGH